MKWIDASRTDGAENSCEKRKCNSKPKLHLGMKKRRFLVRFLAIEPDNQKQLLN